MECQVVSLIQNPEKNFTEMINKLLLPKQTMIAKLPNMIAKYDKLKLLLLQSLLPLLLLNYPKVICILYNLYLYIITNQRI